MNKVTTAEVSGYSAYNIYECQSDILLLKEPLFEAVKIPLADTLIRVWLNEVQEKKVLKLKKIVFRLQN